MKLRTILLSAMLLLLQCPVSLAQQPLTLKDADSLKDRFVSNPRPVKDIGDPHVLAMQGEYFTFATGGPIGFNVWRSTDLVTFTKEKAVKKISWVSGDYWAPEVYPWQGRYVMFFTGREKASGSLRMGVAFSDAPQGPYEDPLGAPLFDFGYAVIDGTLVIGRDGTPYMIYSRDCSENVVNGIHESHLYGVQLAADLLSTVGEPVLLTQPDVPWETVSGDYRWNEGPYVVEHDGRYYLYYSGNYYASKEYSVGVAVADHPLGPYKKQENNPILSYIETQDGVLVSGPGHNSFFCVGNELFTSYHTHTYTNAPSGNRQVCIDRAGFHADGTAYINGPTLAPQLRPLADLGLVNHLAVFPHHLLADGDTCQSASSAAYVFAEPEAVFTFDAPVSADMLLIYPAQDSAIRGKVILNDTLTADFAQDAGQKPGQAVCLSFDAVDVSSLRIVFDDGCRAGEVMLIGAAE